MPEKKIDLIKPPLPCDIKDTERSAKYYGMKTSRLIKGFSFNLRDVSGSEAVNMIERLEICRIR